MTSFIRYLILEAEEAEALSAAGHDDLENKVKHIIRALTTLTGEEHFEERLKSDGRSYSELDLLEALEIVKKVVHDRLAQNPDQYKDDSDHERFFESIKNEINEALSGYFASPDKKGKGPRFINMFKMHIVEPIIAALQKVGPEASGEMVDKMVSNAKADVVNTVLSTSAEDMSAARNILTNYSRKRKQQLDKKNAKQLSRTDRLNLIRKVAGGMPGNEALKMKDAGIE